jgi:hypothetical protein
MTSAPVDYNALRFWSSTAQWGLNLLVMIYLWRGRKTQAAAKRFHQAEECLTSRIDANERDILRVQAELKHLPTQGQFDALGTDIRTLTKSLGNVEGRLEGLNRVADLMNQFLINQGGNKHE